LSALGHDVHVAATPASSGFPDSDTRATWHAVPPPAGRPHLRLLRRGAVQALADRVAPDAIMERYHNFGGEGVLAASRRQALTVLEVNAPVIDYAGSPKGRLDRLLLVEPMRRWRDWQCRRADLIVTPTRAILPAWVDASRVLEVEWGADAERFRPDATGALPYERRAGDVLAVFAGAFRRWHGAVHLVRAIRCLRDRGRRDVSAVLIGDGPELPKVRAEAANLDGVTFTGAVPHEQMPAALAAADIGVAPFDVAAHPALSLGFYWSPLKVLEYMASGLPVVAPDVARLRTIVEHDREGLLYDDRDPGALADALVQLTDGARRQLLGRAARARCVASLSWQAHCRTLDAALQSLR
jgi:glycosyltransferase involved in cell wall biosynthesis